MEIAMYVLYMGLRLMPLNQEGIRSVVHVDQIASETGESIIVKDKTATVTQTDANGFVMTCVNAEDRDVGFAVDFNTSKFDVQKSWRIKLTYPEISYQDIVAQSLGTIERGWNYFSFRNGILFDSLAPMVVSITPNQQVLLWNLPADVECLSTPWVQCSVATNVRAKSIGEFTCHFYDSADLNMDGKVDAVDLALLNGNMGTPVGDVDGDGTTTAKDLSVLLAQWSTSINE